MTTMHPADRTYRNQTVRLADLTVISDVIEDVTFENCIIEGPAVVAMLGAGSMAHCNIEGPVDSFLWIVPDDRQHVIGAVALVNCHIVGCTLRRIGMAVPAADEERMREVFSG